MSAPASDTDPPARRERLRLESATAETHPNGDVSVAVTLEWADERVQGFSDGFDTRENVLRMGAASTVEAVRLLLGRDFAVELLGVKATKAFGTWVSMVYLRVGTGHDAQELLGARALDDDDLVRGGAIAVLDALNRVLSRHLP